MNTQINIIFSACILAFSGITFASPYSCKNQLLNYASFSNNPSIQASIISESPECFAAGITSSLVQMYGTSVRQISSISSALETRFSNTTPTRTSKLSTKSIAAGGENNKWNTWGSINNNDTKQEYRNRFATETINKSSIVSTIMGGDYVLSPRMVVGVSVALDNGSGSGIANPNGGGVTNNMSSKGYSIAPYFGMQISKELALDASIGFGQGNIQTSQGSTSTRAESNRSFLAANVSYESWIDRVQLRGKGGLLYAIEDFGNTTADGSTISGTGGKNTLTQLRLGGQAGYWVNGFMPYAGINYVTDLNRSSTLADGNVDPIGKDAWLLSLGVNFFSINNAITGGLEYSEETARSNQKNNNLIANMNVRF